MVELNLLHSRIEQQNFENKMIRRYLLSALIAALITMICLHGWLQLMNQNEQEALDHLRETVSVPENHASVNVEESNEFSAEDLITILIKSADINLNGICYSQIMRDGSQINLLGNAWSAMGVANLVRQVSLSGLFANVHLLGMKQQNADKWQQFHLEAREA